MTTPCSGMETECDQAAGVHACSSPERINGRLPPYTTPGSMNSSKGNSEDSLVQKQGSPKLTALKRKRKAKMIDDDMHEVSLNAKRRRIDDISRRLRGAEQNSSGAISIPVSAKTSVLNIPGHGSAKKSSYEKDNKNSNSLDGHSERSKHLDSVMNAKNLQLSPFYSSVIKDSSCDTSPFKGKMSAFEISLLKGKQSMERRKSLEAAALRSSPRMNSNLPKPDYADSKRRQRTNSLPQTGVEKVRARKRATGQSKPLRIRTHRTCKNKPLSAVSPSSIENRFVEQNSPVRKRKKKHGNSPSVPEIKINSPKSPYTEAGESPSRTHSAEKSQGFTFRMNGSPKLKHIGQFLSLNSLSGNSQKYQGTLSSFHPSLRANGFSGIPPALPDQSAAVASHDRVKSSNRPDTLSFTNTAIPQSTQPGTSTVDSRDPSASKTQRPNSSRQGTITKLKNKRISLEETVKMLASAKSSLNSSCNSIPPAVPPTCISPAPSSGKVSRRSSRSTTPNISPIQSEVLTPSNTPSSSPSKSPRSSPFRAGGKSQTAGRKRKSLLMKNDDVLARWHDGLLYSGKILKIDDKNSKCLVRYEDNSEFWSMFKDIHRVAKEEEMICCVCFGELSEPPNEIVLCDNCCQGYHQKCHSPHISPRQIQDPDDEWFCRECVFLMATKVGGAVKDGTAGEELAKMKHSLPYQLDTLTWDNQHKNNVEQNYCYCGGPGIWYQKMLQCCRCRQWFHEACIQCLDYPLMFGDSFYIFVCTMCNFGKEYAKRLDVEWQDLMHIALFNLVLLNKRKKFFHVTKDIIPWMVTFWKALQVPMYDNLSREEKYQMTIESLQNNKSRFTCNSELQKPSMLWGLRIRVPPPRIFISLPIMTEVSDDVMKKLKIKGKRSKVFVPMECKSPVLQIHESPLHLHLAARKRLDGALGTKVHWTSKQDQGTTNQIHQGTTNQSPSKTQGPLSSHLRKPRIKLPLLERLIPQQSFYAGCHHPFKTEVEVEEEKAELRKCADIWMTYQTMSSNTADDVDVAEETASDGPPVLEKVEPISPSQSSSSTPPMPEIQKKKRGKKSVHSEKDPSETNSSEVSSSNRRSSRRVSLKVNAPPNITEMQAAKAEISVKKVKTRDGNYFCAFDKTGYGKGFYIMGKRVREGAPVECLVDWDM